LGIEHPSFLGRAAYILILRTGARWDWRGSGTE
jgi:hypothetical protein